MMHSTHLKSLLGIIVVLLSFALPQHAQGEHRIVLNNGQKITCTVLQETESAVEIKHGKTKTSIPRTRIKGG